MGSVTRVVVGTGSCLLQVEEGSTCGQAVRKAVNAALIDLHSQVQSHERVISAASPSFQLTPILGAGEAAYACLVGITSVVGSNREAQVRDTGVRSGGHNAVETSNSGAGGGNDVTGEFIRSIEHSLAPTGGSFRVIDGPPPDEILKGRQKASQKETETRGPAAANETARVLSGDGNTRQGPSLRGLFDT